ncbi:polyprenyl synthetase family protein [Ohessyouella blattaphilus]|uniref:Polyprenyl synthetase family protein n=1 Tax=Ohessyouella blattaphilus TaxID=2949333 RepID=A0ABT1EKJ4_9FIRM|nr:farnesyl diphosphate synthase [Ohessyouella blattaphilus]MCP1111225.1 polyprenyl synthetase family protein [Ohessyouella blattaphilus]MCR8564619.1 polyprenyl synthetase family protein [Ohessyouella blattaphilus]
MSNSNFSEVLDKHVLEVEQIVKSFLPQPEGPASLVMEAMDYSLVAGGKRLRPLLMQESFRLFNDQEKIVWPLMAAMEMIHTYSLVHDDLPAMDNDEYRRGKKTTHVVYGEDMGILAGDALLNYAFETAMKVFDSQVDRELGIQAIRVLGQKAGIYGMIGGQVVDVKETGKALEATTLNYIYEKKTAALIEGSLMIGGITGGASASEVTALEKIGRLVGVAFQIQDDILDVEGTYAELGKPIGSDAKNEKTTYVTLYGKEAAVEAVKNASEEAISLLLKLGKDTAFLEQLLTYLINRRK